MTNHVVHRNGHPFVPYSASIHTFEEVLQSSTAFYQRMNQRRSLRDFTDQPIPVEVIENIIRTASTAPSGANKQPWTFCVVSNPETKKEIRLAAEKEEHESYTKRMSEEWLSDIEPLQTDWNKPFLETAPYLIVEFKQVYELKADGTKGNHYYVNESVGIACGFLLTAIHLAGLAALTHTPSPMNFLTELLHRPENERPYLLIPVGFAAPDALVPDLKRKPLSEVSVWY